MKAMPGKGPVGEISVNLILALGAVIHIYGRAVW